MDNPLSKLLADYQRKERGSLQRNIETYERLGYLENFGEVQTWFGQSSLNYAVLREMMILLTKRLNIVPKMDRSASHHNICMLAFISCYWPTLRPYLESANKVSAPYPCITYCGGQIPLNPRRKRPSEHHPQMISPETPIHSNQEQVATTTEADGLEETTQVVNVDDIFNENSEYDMFGEPSPEYELLEYQL